MTEDYMLVFCHHLVYNVDHVDRKLRLYDSFYSAAYVARRTQQ